MAEVAELKADREAREARAKQVVCTEGVRAGNRSSVQPLFRMRQRRRPRGTKEEGQAVGAAVVVNALHGRQGVRRERLARLDLGVALRKVGGAVGAGGRRRRRRRSSSRWPSRGQTAR